MHRAVHGAESSPRQAAVADKGRHTNDATHVRNAPLCAVLQLVGEPACLGLQGTHAASATTHSSSRLQRPCLAARACCLRGPLCGAQPCMRAGRAGPHGHRVALQSKELDPKPQACPALLALADSLLMRAALASSWTLNLSPLHSQPGRALATLALADSLLMRASLACSWLVRTTSSRRAPTLPACRSPGSAAACGQDAAWAPGLGAACGQMAGVPAPSQRMSAPSWSRHR